MLNHIDCVPSNVQFSHHEALLYVFEDNEAVIKTMIKGRSPTMRQDSRTHGVALDLVAKGMGSSRQASITGGGGLARVPNLRVCKHVWSWGGTRREGRMN